MSRIGKYPVAIPQGVTVEVAGQTITAKGKLGTIKLPVSGEVTAAVQDGKVVVKPKTETKRARVHWGTMRALVNNMVAGVSKGFTKNLEIEGVGYRAAVQGKTLNLTLGFSHAVNFPIPDGISMECPSQTEITVKGIDLQKLGQTCAKIRAIRPPEPYKGKGVRFAGEQITLKEGKKK